MSISLANIIVVLLFIIAGVSLFGRKNVKIAILIIVVAILARTYLVR